MKDIRRVFEYHGAEHKVVFNYESGKPRQGRKRAEVRHLPSALRHQFPAGGDGDLDDRLRAAAGRRISGSKFAVRIALLPLIAGVSYELIRFAAKRQGTLMGLLSRAGLVAAAHHHQAARRFAGRRRHPRAEGRHGARSRSRAANWSSPKRVADPMQYQTKTRRDRAPLRRADGADGRPRRHQRLRAVSQSRQGAQRSDRDRRQVSRVESG